MIEVLEKPPITDTETWPDIYNSDFPRLFFTALLITGTVESAELAIDESIDLIDAGVAPCSRSALIAVAEASAARHDCFNSDARSLLPADLQAVVDLPEDFRLCFVLRRLAGLTIHETADLVGIQSSEVEPRALDASIRLAERSFYAA
jgi:hypothetical protein